jgi:hypothetical protein
MFSKSFALENYFMHIPEVMLDQGQDLLTGRDSLGITCDDKGFWLFKWHDQDEIETEVVTGRKNVRAYSCDCSVFLERKMCPHVAAALYHIFQVTQKEQKKKEQKKVREKPRSPRIPIKQIINQLSEKELKRFLTSQASKNPLLAGELKALFAHKVDLPEGDEKYFLVIKNYLSALSQGKLSEQKFHRLSAYLTNLVRHGEDLASEKNYREAALILLGLLKFLATTIVRFRSQPWEALSTDVHRFLEKLLQEPMSPSFRLDFIKKLRTLYQDENYIILDANCNLFSILYDNAGDEKMAIYSDLVKSIRPDSEALPGLLALFRIALDQKDVDLLTRITGHHLHNLAVLRHLLELTRGRKDMPDQLLRFILTESKGPKIRKWAFDQLISLESDPKLIQDIFINFLVSEERADLLPELKSISGEDWPEVVRQLIELLDQTPHKRLLLELLVLENDQEGIIDLLNRNDDVELLLVHADFLYRKNRRYLYQQLEKLIDRHLTDHIGYQSADYILRIFDRLASLGLTGLIEDLHRSVLRKFPERIYLIKYLKESAAWI